MQTRLPQLLKCLTLTAARWQKIHIMPSIKYGRVILHQNNKKSGKPQLHSKPSTFGKNLMQQNAGYNINARSGTADTTTMVALTTLLLEKQVIWLSRQNTAEPLRKEPVSTYKATGLALNGIQRLLLLKSLVIQQAQTGITVRRGAGFLEILSLSTCKEQL